MKWEIIKYKKTHSKAETLKKFPEISESTLKRLVRRSDEIKKRVVKGIGGKKRDIPLKKYKDMGEKLLQFFNRIREAHGAVSRDLLESYAMTLPAEIVKDHFTTNPSSRDDFWTKWKRRYGLTYRRISGVKQYVPTDADDRIAIFNNLLQSI